MGIFRRKRLDKGKIAYSIDVKEMEHPMGYPDHNYYWTILRSNDGIESVYTSGWASTSEEAWNKANKTYAKIVRRGKR